MRWLVIVMAIGSLMACGGGSSPTAPTPPANVAGDYNATLGRRPRGTRLSPKDRCSNVL